MLMVQGKTKPGCGHFDYDSSLKTALSNLTLEQSNNQTLFREINLCISIATLTLNQSSFQLNNNNNNNLKSCPFGPKI